jgi:hypothetical protein
MTIKSMSLSARRELVASIRQKYQEANWIHKGKLLDGFVAAKGYGHKHAIQMINSTAEPEKLQVRQSSQKYDEQPRQAIFSVWCTANQICSKRLVPFCLNWSRRWSYMVTYVYLVRCENGCSASVRLRSTGYSVRSLSV